MLVVHTNEDIHAPDFAPDFALYLYLRSMILSLNATRPGFDQTVRADAAKPLSG